jgi:SAM-dependent methyltransferase
VTLESTMLKTEASDSVSATSSSYPCRSCGTPEMSVFYEMKNVPVHSCLLLNDQKEALYFPKRNIALGFCQNCGFIQNVIFDPAILRYSSAYEEQQSFSPRFNIFAEELAQDLIQRYGLRGKQIVEIGCGKGDFLVLICRLGQNRGVGVDPSYIPERVEAEDVSFIRDFYDERHAGLKGDMVCCRHTLEHIPDTYEFMKTVRRSVGDREDCLVFFEVPDVGRVLREIAFWDIYYEHCSYFTLGSLARLFRKTDFDVIRLAKEFDDQYLLIDARPGNGAASAKLKEEDDLDELRRDVEYFAANYRGRLQEWRRRIDEVIEKRQRAAIWGSGSKCVSFLSTLGITDEIDMIVDINPHRHGRYLAGSGKKISSPEALREYKPDVVIAMNPIYCDEIRNDLDRMGLNPQLTAL